MGERARRSVTSVEALGILPGSALTREREREEREVVKGRVKVEEKVGGEEKWRFALPGSVEQ